MEPLIYFWLFFVFVIGTCVGSFLNVVIARLPLEKSLVWPGSRCGACLQPVRWYDNLPIFSLILRGRCRTCAASFSPRYLLVELATGLGFVGLFYLEVVANGHDWPLLGKNHWQIKRGEYPGEWWIVFAYHAVLFSFLLAAAACDLDGREIPLPLTLTGTAIGLVCSAFFPWPWPRGVERCLPTPMLGSMAGQEWLGESLTMGLYPWPVWGPLPAWLPPGSWQLGLATGIVGALVGTFMLRSIGFLFSKGLGREALGLGDADLMMMAGAFLGWQAVVVAFFISVFPAMVFGITLMIVKRDNSLPFGPSLAAGVVITWLYWDRLGPFVQPVLFWAEMLLGVVAVSACFMLAASFVLRLLHGGNKAP